MIALFAKANHSDSMAELNYPKTEKEHKDYPLWGIAYGLIAFFLLAFMNAVAKIVHQDYGHAIIEIAFYRNLISMIPFLVFILATRQMHLFKTKTPKALGARSILGTISLVTTFAAFASLPMAEVTVLLFTTTLITPALAYFILKERVGIYRWAAIFIGLIGVIIMVGFTGFSGSWVGITLSLAAASMHAGLGLLLRFMKDESPITVTFYFVTLGTALTAIAMPFIAKAPTLEAFALLIAVGIGGGLAQLFLSLAFKNAPASVVVPMNYTGLIWATGFDIFLFAYIPGWPVFLGATIIIGSNLYILHRERMNERRKAA